MVESLLTAEEIADFGGTFEQHFETFAPFKTVTVNKQPQQIFIDVNAVNFAGYSAQNSNPQNTNYITESQSFRCMLLYNKSNQKETPIEDLNTAAFIGGAILKVELAAKNYIIDGKVENIDIDGKKFNVVSNFWTQNYLGKVWYYFVVEETK